MPWIVPTLTPALTLTLTLAMSTRLLTVRILWRDATDRQPPPTHDREARVAVGGSELHLIDLARARHALLDLLNQRRVPAERRVSSKLSRQPVPQFGARVEVRVEDRFEIGQRA